MGTAPGLATVAQPTLENLASRLGRLIERHDDLSDPLDLLAGAFFYLRMTSGFRERKGALGATYKANLIRRVKSMSAGDEPVGQAWQAGAHFNSALMRIAGAFHRVLKILSSNPGTGKHVRDLLKLFPGAQHAKLSLVHGEVNKLKHDWDGLAEGRDVTAADALAAVHELLVIIENARP